MTSVILWAAVFGLCLIVELMTGTLYLAVIALAAAFSAAATLAGASIAYQIGIFSLSAVVGCVLLHRYHKPSAEVMATEVGTRVPVVSVSPEGAIRVKHRGAEWDAVVEGELPAVGDSLLLQGTQGIKLVCKKA